MAEPIKLITVKVRDGFYVHLEGGGVHPPGTLLQLSPRQLLKHSHQVEIEEEKPSDISTTRKPDARTASTGSQIENGDKKS